MRLQSDTTQSLGKWIPVAETNPTSLDASHDPYVLWRQTKYRLYLVIDEENVLNEQLLALQNRCQHYERLIVQTIQKAIADYTEQLNKECKYSVTVVNELNGIFLSSIPHVRNANCCSDLAKGAAGKRMESIPGS